MDAVQYGTGGKIRTDRPPDDAAFGSDIHLKMRNHMLLTQSEVEIMEILWETGAQGKKITILELIDAINGKYDRELKRQTVSTFLSHLVSKGVADYTKKSKISYYVPVITREEYAAILHKELLDTWYNGDVAACVKSLLTNVKISKKEMEKIKEEINAL